MIHKRIDKKTAARFSKKLLLWHKDIDRQMPWVGIKDPYKIWLSEIILQQTRVEQGKPYYLKFIKQYPTVSTLAKAPLDEVLKLWQGLGYYSRARNLHHTAQQVLIQHQGKFPSRYEELIKLKGIGEYTAAAISSFSANEAHAVLDGNVIRVLSRLFGITARVQDTAGKKFFREAANELLPQHQASLYNQAIMDFGALICLPKNPLCEDCIFRKSCYAYLNNEVHLLPVKKIKTDLKPRYFNYFFIRNQHQFLVSRREQKDIWQGLYELPLIESKEKLSLTQLLKLGEANSLSLKELKIQEQAFSVKQKLSHREIHFNIYTAQAPYNVFKRLSETYKSVSFSDAEKISFPKTLAHYINNSLSSG